MSDFSAGVMLVPFISAVGVLGGGEFAGLGEKGGHIGRRIGQRFLIRGGGRVAGKIEDDRAYRRRG